jgi:NDP-sugar pyrophosphorylase family protein
LGERESYLEAHAAYAKLHEVVKIHPTALLGEGTELDESSCISEGCRVGAGTRLVNTILWPGAEIAAGAELHHCIVRPGEVISGIHVDKVL